MSFLPKATTIGPSRAASLGSQLGMGISTGLQGALSEYMQAQKMDKEAGNLQKALSGLSPEAPFEEKFSALMSAPGVGVEMKKLGIGALVDTEKFKQKQALTQQKTLFKAQQEESAARNTYEAYKKAGYELPEYIPGTPVDVYHKLAANIEKEGKTSVSENLKQEAYQGALDIVGRQKELLKTGHLGPHFGGYGKTGRSFEWMPSIKKEGETIRSEYEQLGKSLITFASQVPIRNRLEFETLSNQLLDPNLPQEQIKGALNGIERILKSRTKSYGKTMSSNKNTIDIQTTDGRVFKNMPIEKANELRKLSPGAKIL